MVTIKRKWFSKKQQKWVEKSYYYNKTKNYRLTTKKGKLSKKATSAYINSLSGNDIVKQMFVKTTLRKYMSEKRVVTARMINAMFSQNQLDIFMANLNISYEQIVKELEGKGINVNLTYVMDKNHWSFTKGTMDAELMLPNGESVGFTFDYYNGYTINV